MKKRMVNFLSRYMGEIWALTILILLILLCLSLDGLR